LFSRNVPVMTGCLEKAVVGIAGCGGLGSNAAVSLTRAGIGKLVLTDFDCVELSNLNRQYFFREDIGKKKVDALSARLLTINPAVSLDIHTNKLTKENFSEVFSSVDMLIEAFDQAEDKQWLIEKWSQRYPEKPIIVGNGLAGYGGNESIKVTKVGNIYFCGDMVSDMKIGLCASRVALVANMQANTAIELLVNREKP